MSIIAIQDLRPLGHSLFDDRESYLNTLSVEDELNTLGGASPLIYTPLYSSEPCAAAISASIIATINW